MKTKGYLSDHTRRWVESYNKILDKIQAAIYGDKSVNLHLHKVSRGVGRLHSQVGAEASNGFWRLIRRTSHLHLGDLISVGLC